MGFFDTYEDTSGLAWIKKEETATLIEQGTALSVLAVTKGADPFNAGGTRYTVVFDLDGEERAKAFTAYDGERGVPSRDALLDAVIDYLEGDDAEGPTVKLVKSGRATLIVEA